MNNDLKKILRDLRRGKETPASLQLNIGEDGALKFKGQDGYTPQKGIDYWTPEEVNAMVKSIFEAAKPTKGVDYYTDTEKRQFVSEILKMATPVKGVHYRDGIDGKDGRDGKDADEIDARKVAIDAINFLESFEGDARLSAKALKDLDEAVTDILKKGADFELSEKQINTIKDLLPKYPPMNAGGSGATFLKSLRDVDLSGLTKNADGKYVLGGGGSGASTFLGLTDTPSDYTGQAGKILAVNTGETAVEFIPPPSGSGDVTKVGTPVDNQVGVWTGDGTIEGDANFTFTGDILTVTNNEETASATVLVVQGDRATPTANDEVVIEMKLSDSAGNQDTMGTISAQALDVTSTSEDSQLKFGTVVAGTLASRVAITGTAIQPNTDDGVALGNATLNRWSDLYLANGGVINWNNGNTTLTHSAGLLTLSSTLAVGGDIRLDNTTNANQFGLITKNGVRFVHDFNYGNNGTVTTEGLNTFVGLNSGNLTMGSGATAVNNASRNTGLGAQTLQLLTTGYYNSAMGMGALQKTTTGYFNNAQGTSALVENTTGYNNSATGGSSLGGNTTGYSNSAIGRNSGRYLADGVTANQTGNNSIFVGIDTRANAAGETNQIVIGSTAIGAGSNSVVLGNDSITKTLLKGNVGIGTTAPDTILDVNGAITQRPLSADPADPDAGNSVTWVSDGTGAGDPGDVMIKINVGGTVKTITLIDFSVA